MKEGYRTGTIQMSNNLIKSRGRDFCANSLALSLRPIAVLTTHTIGLNRFLCSRRTIYDSCYHKPLFKTIEYSPAPRKRGAIMAYLKYEINGYDFMFSYGDGVIIDPDKANLDDPDFIQGLRTACSINHIVESLILLEEWALHGNYNRPLYYMSDADVNRIMQLGADIGYHEIVAIPDDVQEFLNQINIEWTRRQKKQKAKEVSVEKRKAKSAGYVYLITSPTGAYKIGRTVNPDNRLKTFSVKLPFEVEYVATIQTSDMYQLESDLHTRFADKRVNGEWFALSPSDVEFIKGLT